MTISVIIPCYNSGQYIEKCLISLLAQHFQDWELILVDDGSTDDSRLKAEACLAGKRNYTVLTQENRGVSAARNIGMSQARGDWITFVDSDDYLAPDYLEELVSSSGDCDLVISGIIFMKEEKEDHRTLPPDDICSITDLRKEKGFYLDFAISPVGKLYRKEIIDRYNVRFDESLTLAEDRNFNIDYLFHAKMLSFVPYAGYYYQTTHEGSLSKGRPVNQLSIDVLYWNKLYRLLDGTNEAYLAHRLFYFLVDSVSGDLQQKEYSRAIHSLNEVRPLLDRSFLKRNLKEIKALSWQKVLVRLFLG